MCLGPLLVYQRRQRMVVCRSRRFWTIGIATERGVAIDHFPNYCVGARRGKDLVAKGCCGPWIVLLNVNPPRFPVCYSV